MLQWNFYFSNVPITAFVDAEGRVTRYDFWAPNERTFATTRFFNIIVGSIDRKVFDFPQAKNQQE
jgi:hypothetical protein